MGKKTTANPLYLYGILEESEKLKEWMNVQQCSSCDVPYMEIYRIMKEVELSKQVTGK